MWSYLGAGVWGVSGYLSVGEAILGLILVILGWMGLFWSLVGYLGVDGVNWEWVG